MGYTNPGLPNSDHVVAWDITNMASVHITGSYAAYDPGNIVTRHIEKRKQETPLPYDGTAWRLLFYAHDLRSNTLELGVSRGRYSEYRFTSLDEDLRKAVPDPKQWFTALALGILAITDDEKFLVFRRPSDAHLSPNTWDLPCGHPSTLMETPSDYILTQALGKILAKECGYDIPFTNQRPLVLVREEPKNAYDLVFLARIYGTSDEIQARLTTKKEFCFISTEPDSIDGFLLYNLLSRPLPSALLYYGRKNTGFGEEWFMRHCLEKN